MPNTEYNLGLGVKVIDTNIQQQIDNISKTLKDLNIKLDSKDIEKLSVVFSDITKNGKQLQTINAQLKNEQGQILKITQTCDAETQQILNSTTKLLQARKSETQQLKEQAQLTKLQSDKIVLDNRISGYLRENTKLSDGLKNRLIDIQNQISKADKTSFDRLKGEFRELNSEAKALGLAGKSTFDKFKADIGNFLTFITAGGAIMSSVRAIKDLVNNVVELDKSLVDIQMATGYTTNKTKELLDTYIDLGQELGATGVEVANSASTWLRQGKTIAETNELIRASMILSKIGQIDSAQATKFLTSAMKGYKLEASEVLSVVDKLSAIDLSSATDIGGLAEAMSRVANMADLAGVSMDKLLSYIAIIGEVTQKDMASIGQSLQTMFARMGNIKIGKFIDDETGESLNDVEKVLNHLNIKLRDSENSFRNFSDVLDDVASRWGKFSEVEQNAIGVAIAGTRQRENFTVLMSNYSKSLEYTEISANSAGTALDKFSAYEESVEAKTKRLQASLQELATKTINSDIIKSFIDLSNNVINLTTAMGGLGNVVITLGVALGAYKYLLPILVKQMSALLLAETGVTATTMSQIVAQTGLNGAVALGTTAIYNNIIALKAWMTTTPVGWILGIVAAIGSLFAIQDLLTVSLEEQQKKTQKLQDEYSELETKLSDLNSELKITTERIDELNDKDSLTIVEQEELNNLKTANNLLESQNRLLKEQAELKQRELADSIAEEFEKDFGEEWFSITKFTTYTARNQTVTTPAIITEKEYVQELISEYERLSKMDKSLMSEDDIKKLDRYKASLVDYGVKFNDYADRYKIDDETSQSWRDFAVLIDKTINPAQYKQENFDKIFNSDNFKKAKEELLRYAEAGTLSPQVLYYNKKYEELLRETGLAAHEAASYINSMVEKAEDGEAPIATFSETFETLNEALSDLDKKSKDTVSSIKELNQVLYDQSQGTKLTSEQAYKLISQYPQLASALEKTTDGYTINEEAINLVREAMIEQEKANATAQLNMTKDTLDGVADRLEAYNIELDAITDIKSAMSEQNKLSLNKTFGTMEGWTFDDASKRITTPTGSFIANATATEYDSIKKAYEEQKLISDTVGKMGELQDRINGLQSDLLSDKGFGVNTKKDSKSTESSNSTDPIKEAFDVKKAEIDHLLAMEKITQEDYLNRLESLNNAYFAKNKSKYLDQYRKYLEEVYKGRKDIEKKAKDKAKKSAEDKIKSKFDDLEYEHEMGLKTDDQYWKIRLKYAEKYYKKNGEIIDDYLDEYRKIQTAYYKWTEDQAEESAKKQEKIAENLKDKYTDLIGDIADEIKKEKDNVLDGLEETHKSTIKNLEDEKDSYKEIINAQLDILDAKKKQNDYEKSIANKTKEISKIESRKAELKKAANSGDRSAIAELAKLDEELSSKKEDLLDEQSNHEFDLQKESLNNALDLNDKLMDARIDAENEKYETQKSNIEKLYDREIELINKAAQYTKEEFSKALDGIATQLASNGITQSPSYLGSVKQAQSGIANTKIDTSTSNKSAILSILRNGKGKDYGEEASALASYTRDNYGAPISKAQAVEVAKLLNVSGINSVSDLTGNDKNKNKILEALRKAGFSKGGYVDASMIRQTGEHGLALVRHGEPVLTVEQGKLFKELITNIKPLNNLVKLSTPNLSNITNNNNSPITLAINVTGVNDKSIVSNINFAGNDLLKNLSNELRKLK